jgi:hypothetical protein
MWLAPSRNISYAKTRAYFIERWTGCHCAKLDVRHEDFGELVATLSEESQKSELEAGGRNSEKPRGSRIFILRLPGLSRLGIVPKQDLDQNFLDQKIKTILVEGSRRLSRTTSRIESLLDYLNSAKAGPLWTITQS